MSGCIPDPPDNDELIDFRRDTAMGVIQDAGVLRVGIEEHPPFATSRGPAPEGFLVDHARDVAAALGVEAEFEVGSAEVLGDLVRAPDPALDVVFPLIPITEEVARHNAVTDPYWVGHQRLLVEAGSAIEGIDDLAGRRVCALRARSEVKLQLGFEGGQVAAGDGRCGRLANGGVDALTGLDVDLAELAQRLAPAPGAFLIVGEQISTMGYGGLVRDDLPGLADYVGTQLAEAKAEGRWMNWYHRWLGRFFASPPDAPPDMTAEEAAALYPTELDI